MPVRGDLRQEIDTEKIAEEKDIDGISVKSAGRLFLGLPGLLPSTVAAVMEILDRSKTPVEGKHVVVLGRSNVVGKPLALLLLQKHATVTICHSRTVNLLSVSRHADILVASCVHPVMVT